MVILKTTIKCGGCVAAVTPELEKLVGKNWSVDLSSPEKILKVDGEVTEEQVKAALEKAGYKGESI